MRVYTLMSGNAGLVDHLMEHPLYGDHEAWKVTADRDDGVGDDRAVIYGPDGAEVGNIKLGQHQMRLIWSIVRQHEAKARGEDIPPPPPRERARYTGTTGSPFAAQYLSSYTTRDWILEVHHHQGLDATYVQLLDGILVIDRVPVHPPDTLIARVTESLRAYQVSKGSSAEVAAAAEPEPAKSAPSGAAEAARAARRVGRVDTEEQPAPAPNRDELVYIPIDQITHFAGGNVRERFDGIDELADSIREHGVIEPLIVNERDGLYTLIAGERRLRAAGLAGLENVPCIVRHLTDSDALAQMLVENLHRRDLNPIEEARAYQRLLPLCGGTPGGVAERVGMSRRHVAEYLQLLDLPADIQARIASGEMAVKVGLTYLRETRNATDAEREAVRQTLQAAPPSVRQARERISQVLKRESGARAPQPEKQSPVLEKPQAAPPAQAAMPPTPPETGARAPEVHTPPPGAALLDPTETPQPISPEAAQTVRARSLQDVGARHWPAPPDGYEPLFDLESYLPVADTLRHWQDRMVFGAGALPRALGGVDIHIPKQRVWMRGRDLPAVKAPDQYAAGELPLVIRDELLIVQYAAGRVEAVTPDQPVYYRVAMYVGRGGSHKILRQQIVIGDGVNPLTGREIVVNGSDSASIAIAKVPELQEMIKALPPVPDQ